MFNNSNCSLWSLYSSTVGCCFSVEHPENLAKELTLLYYPEGREANVCAGLRVEGSAVAVSDL